MLARLARPFRTERPTGRALRLSAIAAAFGAAVLLGIPLCPFAIVTRHPCPGCGLTRATLALAAGRFEESFYLHPLAVVISPLVVGLLGYNAVMYIANGKWSAVEAKQGPWITALVVVVGAAALLVWIARFFGAFGGPVPV